MKEELCPVGEGQAGRRTQQMAESVIMKTVDSSL